MPDLPIIRFTVSPLSENDPRSAGLLTDSRAMGLDSIQTLRSVDLFFIQGALDEPTCKRLAHELLTDPVTQRCVWRLFQPSSSKSEVGVTFEEGASSCLRVEVALRPGVTDPVAEQLIRAAHEIGILGVERVCTGQQITVTGQEVTSADLQTLARRLLANPVIQRYVLGTVEPIFMPGAASSGQVEVIPLRALDDRALEAISIQRRAALDLAEMKAIQAYYTAEGRDPTDVEFEALAQTWSEHCVHKTFKSRITLVGEGFDFPYPPVVDNLFNTYIRRATQILQPPWLLSAFTDNAGILAFDDQFEVSFKVETHNHPSAIEPFGGANTGVGGVIRDIIGVSAKPIANTDVLCFGPQDAPLDTLAEGVLHPRRIQSGVVAGVQDYGNKMGIPTVNGAIWYDPGFTANPLVFCGCVGIAPRGRHPRQPLTGDRVILLGGRTGRDGLRGATFSSMTMDAQTGEVAGASVQIGDPITEKGVLEVILKARDQGLYHAITDCGAGGLSSAVGEMANPTGVDVDLAQVRLKYPGLAPWEIWLSEAQERMVLAIPPVSTQAVKDLCALYEVDYTDLGSFTGAGRLLVRFAGQPVLDLSCDFLHEGIPQRQLVASRPVLPPPTSLVEHSGPLDLPAILLALLSHPNIASKAAVIRQYDHEVQGGTVVKPLTGVANDGPADACVIKPIMSQGSTGLVLSNGLNPEYGKLDAYRMALCAIDEAVRNAVAVGADPDCIALLDNFCWGDPRRPEVMGALLEATRGCYEGALRYKAPFISGKDSFNNEYMGADGQRHSIPPTLLISAIGIIPDVTHTVTLDLKQAGHLLYRVGDFHPVFGGSHYAMIKSGLEVN
ncbi:MAG TPA: phosphoribosylformylglycinamidine synthase subunit PurS, partial [Anaerolineaceae bacterium]